MAREHVDLEFIKEEDLSASFYSSEIAMPWRVSAIAFQGKVASGSPKGKLQVELSILDGEWELLKGCEEIAEDLSATNSFYFILPDIGDYGSRLRLSWVAEAESTGLIDVAYRLMPI